MNIHPLWLICLLVRLFIILIIWYFNKINNKYNKVIKYISLTFLLSIGFGFINKAIHGSNNEIQINKVFWHETRYVHGAIYILASLYLLNDNLNITLLLLLLDLIFSILYRFLLQK
tara:strand:+ start:158 stop:505 length:348 start_codon:yes stop_codon:yes gene_type:complete